MGNPITPKGLFCYANFFTPKKIGPKDKTESYHVTMVWPDDDNPDLKQLKEAVLAAGKSIDSDFTLQNPGDVKSPLKRVEKQKVFGKPGFEKKGFMARFKCDPDRNQPKVLNEKNQEVSKLVGNTNEVYSGCIGAVSYTVWTSSEWKTIGLNLHNVKKFADGPNLGGAEVTTAEEDFNVPEGAGSDSTDEIW